MSFKSIKSKEAYIISFNVASLKKKVADYIRTTSGTSDWSSSWSSSSSSSRSEHSQHSQHITESIQTPIDEPVESKAPDVNWLTMDTEGWAAPEDDMLINRSDPILSFMSPVVNEVTEVIPKYYTTHHTWKSQTDLCCWYCALPFSGMPWFIPIRHEKKQVPIDENGTPIAATDDIRDNADMSSYKSEINTATREMSVYRVEGNFCTPIHSNQYANDNKTSDLFKKTWDINHSMMEILSAYTGKRITHIPPAEPKVVMKEYSGARGITVEEYRKNLALAMELLMSGK